jgi:dienelactone hydrolase
MLIVFFMIASMMTGPGAAGEIPAAANLESAAVTTGPGTAQEAPIETDLQSAARRFVSIWASGDYQGATGTFDETMSKAMPPEKMKEAWESLTARAGKFEEITGTRTEKVEGYDIVYVTCRLELASVDIKVVYDGERRIAGLWFVPTAASVDSGPPPYAERSAFDETEVTVGSGEWKLPGTLSIPTGEGPYPALVLVHGSGPNDRDETIGPNKPFRDIAWGLASRGIAVLRYEKRTKVHGSRIALHENTITVREEVIDDALAAVSLLGGTERIDPARVFLLGHSLGGSLAPRIGAPAARSGATTAHYNANAPLISGIIVMAGAARPLEDLLVDQYRYIFSLDGEISEQERAQIDSLEAQAARVKDPALSAATPAERLPLGVNAAYWLDLRDYDPVKTAQTLELPILILQGERDYQVTIEDFRRWKDALSSSPRVEMKLYPALNHLFMTGEGKSTPAEYDNAGHVDEEVIADIARWIQRH